MIYITYGRPTLHSLHVVLVSDAGPPFICAIWIGATASVCKDRDRSSAHVARLADEMKQGVIHRSNQVRVGGEEVHLPRL